MKRSILAVALLALLVSMVSAIGGQAATPGGKLKFNHPSPNSQVTFGLDINASSTAAADVAIAGDPTRPSYFLVGATAGSGGLGHYLTTDAGATWQRGTFPGAGNGTATYDHAGNAYMAQVSAAACPNAITAYKSTDGGLNWNAGSPALADPSPADHYVTSPKLAADQSLGSPYTGRLYLAATSLHVSGGCDPSAPLDSAMLVSTSVDSGTTWLTPTLVSSPVQTHTKYADLTVASNGAVYYAYQYQDCTTACEGVPAYQMISRSNNGGQTWTTPTIITAQPISYTGVIITNTQYIYADFAQEGLPINSRPLIATSPSDPAEVYAMWSDGRFESSFSFSAHSGLHGDIVFSRSSDGGQTWSAPIKVNDDAVQGKDQFLPAMTVGSDGIIHASWLDRREAVVDGFPFRVYYSQSTDGGVTWSANQPVGDVTANPGITQGEHSGIAVNGDNSIVMPAWTDRRSGNRAYVDKGTINANTPTPGVTTTPSSPTPTPATCPTVWVNDVPLPAARAGASSAATESYIYTAGGDSGNGAPTNNAWRYDGTGAWQAIPSLPISVTDALGVAGDGKFYVIGGRDATGVATNTVQIYREISGTWELSVPLLNPVYGASGVYLYNGTYVFGGIDAGGLVTGTLQIFDDSIWIYGAFVPFGTAYSVADFDGIKSILMAGGLSTDGTVSNRINAYDFADNRWNPARFTNMPNAWYAMGGGQLGDTFYVVGGSTNEMTPTARTISFNQFSNVWSERAPLNHPSARQQIAKFNNKLYIIGGMTNANNATARVERYEQQCGSPTPAPTATFCPNPFVDIQGNVFAPAIAALYCRGIVGGVDATHYGPAGAASRAQFAKVVVLGFGLQPYTPSGGGQHFTDVPPGYFAYPYIETGYHAGILNGFDAAGCGQAGATYPCYLPNRSITRAQLTKLVVAAGNFTPYTPSSGQTFSDVGPSNVFFASIETAHHLGIINGYPDNTFRPNNNIRRDEMAQIVYKGITTPLQ